MGTALFDAEEYLKSIKYKFTPAEEEVLVSCKERHLGIFILLLLLFPLLYGEQQEELGMDIESILLEELLFVPGSMYLGNL